MFEKAVTLPPLQQPQQTPLRAEVTVSFWDRRPERVLAEMARNTDSAVLLNTLDPGLRSILSEPTQRIQIIIADDIGRTKNELGKMLNIDPKEIGRLRGEEAFSIILRDRTSPNTRPETIIVVPSAGVSDRAKNASIINHELHHLRYVVENGATSATGYAREEVAVTENSIAGLKSIRAELLRRAESFNQPSPIPERLATIISEEQLLLNRFNTLLKKR